MIHVGTARCEFMLRKCELIEIDTNNLLTLFTQLYSNKEVLEKVVIIKADHFDWQVDTEPMESVLIC